MLMDDNCVARDTALLATCTEIKIEGKVFYMAHTEDGNTTFLCGSPGSLKTLDRVYLNHLTAREGDIWLQGYFHGFAIGHRESVMGLASEKLSPS